MLHTVDTNKLHVNIIMLRVDIHVVYLACMGQKYATIDNIPVSLHL